MPHRQLKRKVVLPPIAYAVPKYGYNRYKLFDRNQEWDLEAQDWIKTEPATPRSLLVHRQNDLFARIIGWRKDDQNAT